MPKTLAELTSALSKATKSYEFDELYLEAFISSQESKEEDFQPFIQTLRTKGASSIGAYAIGLARNISFGKSNPASPLYYSKKVFDWLENDIGVGVTHTEIIYCGVLPRAINEFEDSIEDKQDATEANVDIEWDALIIEIFKNGVRDVKSVQTSYRFLSRANHYLARIVSQEHMNRLLNAYAAAIGHLCRYYRQFESPETIAIAQHMLTSFFNTIAIRHDQKDGEHLLLKSFLDLNFQPDISLENLWKLHAKSSTFEFLHNYFLISLEKVVKRHSCAWEDRNQLTRIMAMGVDPLSLEPHDTSPDKKSSRELKDVFNSYASDILEEIKNYLLKNAEKFTVHKYEFNFCCLHFSFFGGKEYDNKKLPHGLYKFVKTAEKARQKPHLAYELLREVLSHAQNTAPVGAQKPDKRAAATHAAYQALGNWDVDSEIVSSIIKEIRKKYISSVLTNVQLPRDLGNLICDFADASVKPLKELLPATNELTADEKLELEESEKNAALWAASL